MAKRPNEEVFNEARRRIEQARKAGATTLDLSGLELTTLPPEIGSLAALQNLDLSRNQLATLPPEIGSLTALQELNVNGNRLITLPPEIGLLRMLRGLAARQNGLTTLPPEIRFLTMLQKIGLGANQFTTLPPVICSLTTLKEVYVWDNQLTTLPPEIGSLTALKTLNLAGNQLTTLPPEICSLTTLQTLNLAGNRLTTLPPEIGRLTKLGRLYLHKNPGLELPEEVLGPQIGTRKMKAPSEILAAYFRIAGQAGETLGECKIIVVGRGGVGKTTLVKRLNREPYDANEQETHGIQIRKLPFEGKRGSVLGRVWDFGGQVVLHSMHEFFLTARSLYVLVLGERDDMLERDAAYWLQLIRSYAGDAPVVVVLNKSSGRQRNFDRATLAKNFGPILGWVPTECSEPSEVRSGIARLRQTLTAALDGKHMESVRRKFPRKWGKTKDAVEGMTASFLSYAAFQKLCRQQGERSATEQAALAGDLHDLGIALHYARDPRLRDTTVLRPDWLANGIYAVLRANDLDAAHLPAKYNRALASDGTVTRGTLVTIHRKAAAWGMLNVKDYPPAKRAFLLRLMELFHLSYPLDAQGKVQLVPTLLPPTPPKGTDEPRGPGLRRLRYEFDVVPAPLLPWFIAKNYSLIPDRRHWRRGTMLRFGRANGKVWMTQDERYVFATVDGPEKERDRLLAIIRGTLYRIFREYKALKPKEQWEHRGDWVPTAAMIELGAGPGVPAARRERWRSRRTRHGQEEERGGRIKRTVATRRLARAKRAVRLFISYSHRDKDWMGWVKPLLDGFQYDNRLVNITKLDSVHAWHDEELPSGNPWDAEIKGELRKMNIFVPLISHHFFSSWYVQKVELPLAEKRQKKIKVVPILLHDVNLKKKCPFLHQFPAVPAAQCWSKYADRRDAHGFIDDALWAAIEQVANAPC